MPRMISVRLLVLVLLLASPLAAQDSFVVMSVKGKVEFAGGKTKKWKKLEVGGILRKTDVVRTSFASYAKIMVNKQRLVSVDENTTKPLAEFLKDRSKSGQSSTGKILQFAAEQLNRTKQKQGTSYGAVRGMEGVFSAVFPKYDIRKTDPVFEWVDGGEATNYELILLDENYDVIARQPATGMALRHSGSPQLEYGKNYYWRIRRVKDGVAYPPLLMPTGANDPRVDPMHSRKMVARLQAATGGRSLVLLRASASSGHGIGTPLDQRVAVEADVLAFLFAQLGMAPPD